MKNNMIAILDFGSQYNQLIARRVRECRVYCEILPHNISISDLLEKGPKGIILSGGPASILTRASRCAMKRSSSWVCPSSGSVTGCN